MKFFMLFITFVMISVGAAATFDHQLSLKVRPLAEDGSQQPKETFGQQLDYNVRFMPPNAYGVL